MNMKYAIKLQGMPQIPQIKKIEINICNIQNDTYITISDMSLPCLSPGIE